MGTPQLELAVLVGCNKHRCAWEGLELPEMIRLPGYCIVPGEDESWQRYAKMAGDCNKYMQKLKPARWRVTWDGL